MRWSSFVIAGFWALAYIPVVMKFLSLPARECLPQYPSSFALIAIVLPLVVFIIGALKFSQSPWYWSPLARFIDTRAGEGAYESFLVRFRPLLFFGIAGPIEGLYHVWWCHQAGVPASIQSRGWFLVSGGAAFIILHVILRLRRAQAV